jgi:Lsr2
MAKETIVQLTDDLDGGEASEELTFALRGVEYEIDLSAKNVAALEKALAKFVNAGRKVGRTTTANRKSKAPRGRKDTGAKQDVSAIRTWARANGYEISNRGRISASIREAYESASL